MMMSNVAVLSRRAHENQFELALGVGELPVEDELVPAVE